MVLVSGGTWSSILKSHNMTAAGPLSGLPPIVKLVFGYQTTISIVPGGFWGEYVLITPFASFGIVMGREPVVCVSSVIA
jgi:hypothetical protein